MAQCPFRLDSPRSFPAWGRLGLSNGEEQQDSGDSSGYDSAEAAAAAEEQLLNDSLELMAQTTPATFADEEDFFEQVARQQDDEAGDEVCETFFSNATALAGAHVRVDGPARIGIRSDICSHGRPRTRDAWRPAAVQQSERELRQLAVTHPPHLLSAALPGFASKRPPAARLEAAHAVSGQHEQPADGGVLPPHECHGASAALRLATAFRSCTF